MYVNAGKLNKRIAIYRRTEDPNKPGYSAPASDPELVHECWAQFSQTSGTELIKANADFGEEKVRFLIRYTKFFVILEAATKNTTFISTT